MQNSISRLMFAVTLTIAAIGVSSYGHACARTKKNIQEFYPLHEIVSPNHRNAMIGDQVMIGAGAECGELIFSEARMLRYKGRTVIYQQAGNTCRGWHPWGIVPGYQISTRYQKNDKEYHGWALKVRIIEDRKEREEIIRLLRKAGLEGEIVFWNRD